MAYIPPVSLPSAAGVNFGEGDVRHFSQGDAVTVPGLSNPTRHLATRDSLLAEALNAVIAEVNNHEQIIPLPVYRLVVPPSSEEVVANHRIPVGYEARVLNAAISSSPVSADIELNIMFSTGFGNVSGTTVMTTTSESSGGTTFSPAGEFIVQVKNKGNVTLELVASVMITMRPITDVSGALLPAATIAPPGPPGRQGDKGEKGNDGGTGPAGSPGLNFRNAWVRIPFPIAYAEGDVVTHNFAGTSQTSSYVCTQGHIANGVNEPQPTLTPSPFWDFIAQAGATGATGGTGSAGSGVTFTSSIINGTITTGSDYVAASPPWNTNYSNGNVLVANTQYIVQVNENTAENLTGTPIGFATLGADYKMCFYGGITITLPTVADNGADVDYSSDYIKLVVAVHGTEATTPWAGPEITPLFNGYKVHIAGTTAVPVQLALFGSQVVL